MHSTVSPPYDRTFHVVAQGSLLAAGAVLAIALLVQTVINYRYVSNNLILQDARRVAQERVRNVERAARLARPQDAEAFRVLLDELRADTADQLAGIALVQSNGTSRGEWPDDGRVVRPLQRGLPSGTRP